MEDKTQQTFCCLLCFVFNKTSISSSSTVLLIVSMNVIRTKALKRVWISVCVCVSVGQTPPLTASLSSPASAFPLSICLSVCLSAATGVVSAGSVKRRRPGRFPPSVLAQSRRGSPAALSSGRVLSPALQQAFSKTVASYLAGTSPV